MEKATEWETFLEGLRGFSEDFLADGREPEIPSPREEFFGGIREPDEVKALVFGKAVEN